MSIPICLTVLCQHREYADYQAFPKRALSLDPSSAGFRLSLAGANRVRTDGRRLTFGWQNADITLFPTGRLILERVRPKDRRTALTLVGEILHAAGGRFHPVVPSMAPGLMNPRTPAADCIWPPLPIARAPAGVQHLSSSPVPEREQPPFPPIPLLCRPVDFPHLPQLTPDRLEDTWNRD